MDLAKLQQLAQAILSRQCRGATFLAVDSKRLRGGISAGRVTAVTIRFRDAVGRPRTALWVFKELSGLARREAAVYRWLGSHLAPFVPRVVEAVREPGCTTLVLEHVVAADRWPWHDVTPAEAVLRAAAELHEAALGCDDGWDYDDELRVMAASTLDVVAEARRTEALPIDGPSFRALRRLVQDLPEIRGEILRGFPFSRTLIHGDLHPGNVIISRRAEGLVPRVIDWGRARRGSPLEDVASWVQSLGCWEPAARLRHDTLVRAYLRARGRADVIPSEVREAYWLAGASNALAGALRHHVLLAATRSAGRAARARALWAVHDWLRIIRRAAATWGAG